ncbi:HNH endonuclease [Mesorhizobium sangaii]|uniref:5-methylcytosine-specific restriction protein A n=1 Tax=Mesorhizobium sangaii TaxID=505389 RepID=A0A841PGS4_9HYPH|nr:HNH endonuclease [Mesorhizobium sangaii]MBB6411858.1 5-methylcytosine-specific restriction protein A [Mesorhizobium sangaii]
MSLSDLTRSAVELAIAEYDQIGPERFLEKYGFGKARKYFLVVGDREYHSKAIAGAAHGYIPGQPMPLRSIDFSGGENTVAHVLGNLGFVVRSTEAKPRNPTWSRDELILALDFYMENPASPPGKTSSKIAKLSEELNKLAAILGVSGDGQFRNPNGVYMKVMNFRRFDPAFAAVGNSGLSHGGRQEELVWNEFSQSSGRLHAVASAIRAAIVAGTLSEAQTELGYMAEAEEGRLLTVLHQRRERNRKLVEARKQKALDETNELRCEACDLSFGDRYGPHGDGFIEVHHVRPLHTLREGDKTALSDLALVCANCHRMIHRRQPWLSVKQVRALVNEMATAARPQLRSV